MQKPWEGRFREKTDELVEEFTSLLVLTDGLLYRIFGKILPT
jgi:hypothetical protein